jgi:hypothetical protein
MEFIKDNPDAVNDAINEFGWDGCGRDIYKAGQLAEFTSIQQELYDELEDIIKYLALDFIDSTDEADDDAEKIWQTLTDEQKDELLDEFIADLEYLDDNSRLDDIVNLYNEFVQKIIANEEI